MDTLTMINNYKAMRSQVKKNHRIFNDLESEYRGIYRINSLARGVIGLDPYHTAHFHPEFVKTKRVSRDDMTAFMNKYRDMLINVEEIKNSIRIILKEIKKIRKENKIFAEYMDIKNITNITNNANSLEPSLEPYVVNNLRIMSDDIKNRLMDLSELSTSPKKNIDVNYNMGKLHAKSYAKNTSRRKINGSNNKYCNRANIVRTTNTTPSSTTKTCRPSQSINSQYRNRYILQKGGTRGTYGVYGGSNVSNNHKRNQTGHFKYKILENEGGGDCFFYSVIDSGISFNYNGRLIKLGQIDHTERRNMVKKLRQMVVTRIKEKVRNGVYKLNTLSWEQINDSAVGGQFIQPGNFTKWFSLMLTSGYWADEYMITTLAEIANFIPILINSDDKLINCNVMKSREFEQVLELPKGTQIERFTLDDSRKEYYDDFNLFSRTAKKIVFIDYIKLVHFRLIYTDDKRSWDGFMDLDDDMKNKIIKECHFKTKEQAEQDYKNELLKFFMKRR